MEMTRGAMAGKKGGGSARGAVAPVAVIVAALLSAWSTPSRANDGGADSSAASASAGGATAEALAHKSPLEFGEAEFKPVRESIAAIPRAHFDYEKLCIPTADGGTLDNGESKFVCHLREHPEFALLFERKPRPTPKSSIHDEQALLSQIVSDSREHHLPVTVVPFDHVEIAVPCYRMPIVKGADSPPLCAAFLEAWLPAPQYTFWHHYHFSMSTTLSGVLRRLSSKPDALRKACSHVGDLLRLAETYRWAIDDAQGFLSSEGDLIIADPRAIVREEKGATPPNPTVRSAVNALTWIMKSPLCASAI